MIHPDARKWNKKYSETGAIWLQNRPNRLLVEAMSWLPETGLALDMAAGVGTNGLFLAELGWQVIALDISETGLRLARQRALAQQLPFPFETAVVDLSSPWLPTHQVDLILNFRFLERATFPQFKRALKPGGWLIFETFLQRDTAVVHPHYYLRPRELQNAFSDFAIWHYVETDNRVKDVAQLIAQKPQS